MAKGTLYVVEVVGRNAWCERLPSKRAAHERGRELRHYGHAAFCHPFDFYVKFIAPAGAPGGVLEVR